LYEISINKHISYNIISLVNTSQEKTNIFSILIKKKICGWRKKADRRTSLFRNRSSILPVYETEIPRYITAKTAGWSGEKIHALPGMKNIFQRIMLLK